MPDNCAIAQDTTTIELMVHEAEPAPVTAPVETKQVPAAPDSGVAALRAPFTSHCAACHQVIRNGHFVCPHARAACTAPLQAERSAEARRDAIVLQYLPLVKKIARRLAWRIGMRSGGLDDNDQDDLLGEGYLALVKAIRNFRPAESRGSNLTAYVFVSVRWAIRVGLLRRNLDLAMIARQSKTTASKTRVLSLNEPISPEGNETFLAILADPKAQPPEHIAGETDGVRCLLRGLPELHQEILILHFVQDWHIAAIASHMGFQCHQVQFMLGEALEYIRRERRDDDTEAMRSPPETKRPDCRLGVRRLRGGLCGRVPTGAML